MTGRPRRVDPEDVVSRYRAGASAATVASMVGVSRQRVAQILDAQLTKKERSRIDQARQRTEDGNRHSADQAWDRQYGTLVAESAQGGLGIDQIADRIGTPAVEVQRHLARTRPAAGHPRRVNRRRVFTVEDIHQSLRSAATDCGSPLTRVKYDAWVKTQTQSGLRVPSLPTVESRGKWSDVVSAAGITPGSTHVAHRKQFEDEALVEAVEQFQRWAAGASLLPSRAAYDRWRDADATVVVPSSATLLRTLRLPSWVDVLAATTSPGTA